MKIRSRNRTIKTVRDNRIYDLAKECNCIINIFQNTMYIAHGFDRWYTEEINGLIYLYHKNTKGNTNRYHKQNKSHYDYNYIFKNVIATHNSKLYNNNYKVDRITFLFGKIQLT